jgi:hypothetical protein
MAGRWREAAHLPGPIMGQTLSQRRDAHLQHGMIEAWKLEPASLTLFLLGRYMVSVCTYQKVRYRSTTVPKKKGCTSLAHRADQLQHRD